VPVSPKVAGGFKINVIDCLSQNCTQQRHSAEAFVCVLQSQLLTHVGQLNVMNTHCEFSTRFRYSTCLHVQILENRDFHFGCMRAAILARNYPLPVDEQPPLHWSPSHNHVDTDKILGRQSFPRPMATESSIFYLLRPRNCCNFCLAIDEPQSIWDIQFPHHKLLSAVD